MIHNLNDYENDNEDMENGGFCDSESSSDPKGNTDNEANLTKDNNNMFNDDNTDTTETSSDYMDNNIGEIETPLREQIVKTIPEILIFNNFSNAEPLDFDKIVKKTEDDTQNKIVFPDPTQEILNHDVDEIKFAGYNTIDIELVSDDRKHDNYQESYDKWLSQHKAIVKSSGKQNMLSKAPSLKNIKENSPNTKFIKLDINKPIEKPMVVQTYTSQSKDEETVEIRASERKPKTQFIPNSPAPMPDFNLQKKKTFDEKLKDSKKETAKKKKHDDDDIFGIPPTPE